MATASGGRRLLIGLNGSLNTAKPSSLISWDSTQSNYGIWTGDASAVTQIYGTTVLDNVFHTHKLTNSSSNVIFQIDGVTNITKTTNIPDSKMEPYAGSYNQGSANTSEVRIRYMEAYNT